MLKTSKIILRTFSWSNRDFLLKASSINPLKSQKFHVTASMPQVIKDYEHFHGQMRAFKPTTMPEFFNKTMKEFGNRTALMHKKEGSAEWTPITYNEYKAKIDQIAKAFIKLGLEEEGKVAVLAFNSVEWFLSQLGAIFARGQIVGIYTTNSAETCHYMLDNCRASIVVVDSNEQLEKILSIKDKLPHLKAIVKTLSPHPSDVEGIWKWSDLEKMKTDDVESEYRRRLAEIKPSDCCSVSYTSGTTGNPKGALISHDNFVWEVESLSIALRPILRGEEVIISYMPLAHMSGQLSDIMMAIWSGATIYFADKDAFKGTLIDTLRAARPTIFMSVPRVYEKLQERILQATAEMSGFRRALLAWAQRVTFDYHVKRLNSGGNDHFSLQYELARKLVLRKVKATLGFDRCRSMVVGAAPVSVGVTKFFMSLDLPLQEVYGMTEATGISFLRARWHRKLDTLGKALPGLEAKIADANEEGFGEICTRGRNTFMGYMNDPAKTKEMVNEEGWIRTGDVGYIDSEGFLHMTGRIKELIITAGGENVPYLHIENLVRSECKAISNTFLIGDRRKFLSMLVTLKTEVNGNGAPCDELAPDSLKLMRDLGLNYTLLSEVLSAGPDPKVMAELQAAVERANEKAISHAQKVQKFAILPNDFSIATGELNATMKLKRNVVLEKYKGVIDNFYA